MSKSKTVGAVIILISAVALGVCGYLFYDRFKSGAPDNLDPNTPVEPPMNLEIPNYEEVAPYNVTKPVPNNDLGSYRIIEHDDLRFTYQSIAESSKLDGMMPSVGKPNIFVVPVEFEDLAVTYHMKWNEKKLTSLNGAFNGTKPDCTNEYHESVRSFYRKSSYGLLDINFMLADVFHPNMDSRSFISYESSSDGGGTYRLLDEFYTKGRYQGQKINWEDDKLDINQDGYIDGIWLIYNEERIDRKYQMNYWPYCFWYADEHNKYIGKTSFSAYANCSVNFTFLDSDQGLDAHTITHETGHMMGLDDYYSYDFNGGQVAAMGGMDMMDFNIGEHNSFSKTSLGWTNVIVPETSGSFTLRPFEETGDCLIISPDFNDSAFSEYIILEYYTPTGLNEFDSLYAYTDRPRYFSQSGLRAFHVDARLLEMVADINTNDIQPKGYLPSSATRLKGLIGNKLYYYLISHSNTRSRNNICPDVDAEKEDLISVITANGMQLYGQKNPANNKSLFKPGDKFNFHNHKKFFSNSDLFTLRWNDQSELTSSFEVTSMNEQGITVSVTL